MSLKTLTDELESLDKKRGQYAGNPEYYKVTVEMDIVERRIKRLVSNTIGR